MALPQNTETVLHLLRRQAVSNTSLEEEWYNAAGRLNAWAGAIGLLDNGRTQRAGMSLERRDMSSHLDRAMDTSLDAIAELVSTIDLTVATTGEDSDLPRRSLSNDSAIVDEQINVLMNERNVLRLVNESISCLNAMVPACMDPAPHDAICDPRYQSIAFDQGHDVSRIREKYRDAPDLLRQRLGRLNWCRRILREYARIVKEGIQSRPQSTSIEPATDPPYDVAHSRPRPATTIAPESVTPTTQSAGGQNSHSTQPSTMPSSSRSVFDPLPRDDDSQSSAGSISSSATFHPSDVDHIAMPSPPQGCLAGTSFDCEICHRHIHNTKGARKWKRHVLRDLKPYVCTYEDCMTKDAMFASRRQWFEHEMNYHCSVYTCLPPCHLSFDTIHDFSQHIEEVHGSRIDDTQLKRLGALRRTVQYPEGGLTCPLCDELLSLRQYEKHVGAKLEQIALFTLPYTAHAADDNDDDDNNDDDSSNDSSGAVTAGSDQDMNISERMALGQDKDRNAGSGPSTLAVARRPDYMLQGIPYCRRNGRPERKWNPGMFNKDRPYSCTSLCGETFASYAKWKAHEELNFPRAFWSCRLCTEVFPRRDRLRDHKKKQHGVTQIDGTERQHLSIGLDFSERCMFGCVDAAIDSFVAYLQHTKAHFHEFLPQPEYYEALDVAAEEDSPAPEQPPEPPAVASRVGVDPDPESGTDTSVPVVRFPKPRVVVRFPSGDTPIVRFPQEDSPPPGPVSPYAPEKGAATLGNESGVDYSVLQESKHYANAEKRRLAEIKRQQQKVDKEAILQDLRKFAPSKMPTLIPNDVFASLPKESVKQKSSVEKARAQHELANTGKEEKPQHLRDFARTFKLKTPVPSDLNSGRPYFADKIPNPIFS